MKYIDVEPNTEYTFVADYLVAEYYDKPELLDNNGSFKSGDFGIAMVNTWNPHSIASVNFKNNYTATYTWQKLAVTFNTNGYEQVGIYVRDNGGAAYFDNISLFKTSDGSEVPVEDQPEEVGGEIVSDKYVVSGLTGNKTLTGVVAGTTVGEILNTLKDKGNIKAFDDKGEEITDMTVPVGTNYSFRYLDGFSSSDAATVYISGDLDCDGKVTSIDMNLMMKYILSPLGGTLDYTQILVADVHFDGKITVNDLALVSMHITGDKALAPITLN
jgi:hypothetical protein